MNIRLMFSLLLGLLLLPHTTFSALAFNTSLNFSPFDSAKLLRTHGYTGITYYENGFAAVGSDGRIDRISLDGKVTRSEKIVGESFTCILAAEHQLFIAGENGSILVSSNNGPFMRMNSGTVNPINCLALFNEKIIAGTDGGEILIGGNDEKFSTISLNLKGNIVSLSAGETDCYGVTDQGEIISSRDGIYWNVFDFNAVYAGFYKPCRFTKILVTPNNIAVIGIYNDGMPVLMLSTHGNVWTERTVNYNDAQANYVTLSDTPNDIFYDPQRDLLYIACNNGTILSIPSCSHCNKAAKLTSEDLTAIWCVGDTLLVAGTSFYVEAITLE